jgi:hypothetical protein
MRRVERQRIYIGPLLGPLSATHHCALAQEAADGTNLDRSVKFRRVRTAFNRAPDSFTALRIMPK